MRKKAYIEITNRCNLRCAFCVGTRRPARDMTPGEFALVLDRLGGWADYVYLHVMGEPLLHPELPRLMALAHERGQRVCITTNGTLLLARRDELLAAPNLLKLSVSLHSFEGNGGVDPERYLSGVWDFADEAAKRGVIVALRLWNGGGMNAQNRAVEDFLRARCGGDWPEKRGGSFTLRENLYLERAEKFDWPDLSARESGAQFCRGLRDQLGVLADGTVVPCCLDHEGDIALGNLFAQPLEEILHGPRAEALYAAFSARCPNEELCRRCGFAARFSR